MPVDAIFPSMRWTPGVPPGVYEVRRPDLTEGGDVRMDVAAFVGLTERGPEFQAVPIESWEDFRDRFGEPGGGRLLPETVHQFFVNGGRRCIVVRVVSGDAERAAWPLPGLKINGTEPVQPAIFEARSPGAWGERLELVVEVRTRDVSFTSETAPDRLRLPFGTEHPQPHALLRLIPTRAVKPQGPTFVAGRELAEPEDDPNSTGDVILQLRQAPASQLAQVEEVSIDLTVRLGTVVERWEDLGLHPGHERYLLDVVRDSSALVRPSDGARPEMIPLAHMYGDRVGRSQTRDATTQLTRGDDAAAGIERKLFMERELPDESVQNVLEILRRHDDRNPTQPVSLLALPDLLHLERGAEPETPDAPTPPGIAWPRFERCTQPELERPRPPEEGSPKLGLDAEELRKLKRRIVEWCEANTHWVVVLDVSPGLFPQDVAQLRRWISSDRAALYSPYLRVAPAGDPDAALITIPPCGTICGVIARVERAQGVFAAPANVLVRGVERLVDDTLSPGFLHRERVNEIRETERGLSVLGSRTTSVDPAWTHVSVRRLIDFLARQVEIDSRWAVFEPNAPDLWTRLRLSVEDRLRTLFDEGALKGATTDEAYFVSIDDDQRRARDEVGRVTLTVGVAAAVPVEFIVFQLTLLPTGSVQVGGVGA